MIDFLKKMFWPDSRRRDEPVQGDQGRKLEMDEPMAAAGAQLAGEQRKSETEQNLKKGD